MTRELVETLSDVSNWILVASLVIGVLATGAAVIFGNLKEDFLNRDLAASMERSAALEKEAANANLRLEVLRSQIKWRELSIDQVNSLAEALKGLSFDLSIHSLRSDAESANYANQLVFGFKQAGINAHLVTDYERGIGVVVASEETANAKAVMRALSQARIAFDRAGPIYPNTELGRARIDIIVGSLPPPT